MNSHLRNRIVPIGLVSCLFFGNLCCGDDTGLAPEEAAIAESIHQLLSAEFTPDMPGASVLVARDDRVVFHRAYGLASLELETPISPDMVFALGSLTKKFTATVVCMLAEEGALALEDPISKYVVGLELWGERITIDHLLSHRSGVPDLFSEPRWIASWKDPASPQDLVDFFRGKELLFEPGSKAAYSNSNYVLLALAIEMVTGASFEDVVRSRINEPLGLDQTSFLDNHAVTPHLVEGYQLSSGGFEKPWFVDFSHLYGAGSMVSSTEDLFHFHRALVSASLIDEAALGEAFAPSPLAGGGQSAYARIGYFHPDQVKGHPGIDFSGAMLGFEVHEKYIAEQQVFVCVLTNISGGPMTENPHEPGRLAKLIAGLALGVPVVRLQAIELSREDLERYVGVYELEDGGLRIITLEDGGLCSQRSGGSKNRLFPSSRTEFFSEGAEEARFLFTFDEEGNVVEANWRDGADHVSVGKRTDRSAPAKRQAIEISESSFEAVVGTYEDTTGVTFKISRADNAIDVSATGMPPATFVPASATQFFHPDTGWELVFTIGPEGQAAGLRFSMQEGRIQMEAQRIR